MRNFVTLSIAALLVVGIFFAARSTFELAMVKYAGWKAEQEYLDFTLNLEKSAVLSVRGLKNSAEKSRRGDRNIELFAVMLRENGKTKYIFSTDAAFGEKEKGLYSASLDDAKKHGTLIKGASAVFYTAKSGNLSVLVGYGISREAVIFKEIASVFLAVLLLALFFLIKYTDGESPLLEKRDVNG